MTDLSGTTSGRFPVDLYEDKDNTYVRAELPGVLARCGASGLIVTHDPEEALAICDRVAVLEAGRLHQCASPREMVETPATAFVGRFVLQGNVLPAEWQGHRLRTPLGWLEPEGVDPDGSSDEPLQGLLSPQGLELFPDEAAEAWVGIDPSTV